MADGGAELFDSFDAGLLDRPLPALPATVAEGDAVVIARWAGPRFGALACVINNGADEDDGERSIHLDGAAFRRVAGGWEQSRGDGGTDWHTVEEPLLRRSGRHPALTAFCHCHSGSDDGWSAAWAMGLAGADAAWVEVTDRDGVVRMPLEAPLGYFIVAWNAEEPAVLRVLDGNELPLATQRVPGFAVST